MKKKIVGTALAVTMLASSMQAFAAFPQIQFGTEQSFEISLRNESEIGTISSEGAAFQVEFYPKNTDNVEYDVAYSIDGGEAVSTTVSVPPATKTVKAFPMSVKNGIHTLNITISKDGDVVQSEKREIYVMNLYEPQFMDEFSGRGVNTHQHRETMTKDYDTNMKKIKYAGYKTIRSAGGEWAWYEKQKGVYDFSQSEKWHDDFEEYGVTSYDLLSYGTTLYKARRDYTGEEVYPIWHDVGTASPQTHEDIWAWAKLVLEYAKKFDIPWSMQVWNEPNHYTQDTVTKSQIYADFLKPTRVYLDYNGKSDVELSGFALSNNDPANFLQYAADKGAYPYFDTVSYHPYTWVHGFESNRLQEANMSKVTDVIDRIGGWKDIDFSEIGFTTVEGSATTASLESASMDVVKLYTISDSVGGRVITLYDFINDGENATYTEHNFGQIKYDGTPKPQYLTTAEYNLRTQGGIYMGEINLGMDSPTRAFMYYKDGKPIVVAWTYQSDGSTKEWSLTGENVDIYDVYGNQTHSGVDSVTLAESPVYIEGLSDAWYARTAHDEIERKGAEWLADYGDKLTSSDKSEIQNIFKETKNAFTDGVTSEEVANQIENMSNFGIKLMSYAKNGNLEDMEVSSMLYQLYKIIEKANALYIAVYDGEAPELSLRADRTNEASYAYKDYLQTKQYSDAILRFALRYSEQAQRIVELEDNPNKNGVLKGYELISNLLCDWYDEFSSFESIYEKGLLIQTPFYDREPFINEVIDVEVSLDNYSKRDFDGKIKIFDENGEVVSESEQLKVAGNGEYKQIYMSLKTPKPESEDGFLYYTISYVDNDGNVIASQPTTFKVKDKFNARMLASTQTTDKLEKLQLEVENLDDEKATAHVKLESDENFTFAVSSVDVELKGNEKKVVDIPISSIRDTKYHFYSFKYDIYDDAGYLVAAKDDMMSFTPVAKANEPIDVENWDGDITMFEDAYPIYINSPDGVTKAESWNNAECATRAFVKWDESNVYILADVYDEQFLQEFNGMNIWQGDSIQLSLDPLNDGNDEETNGYRSDDYEIGFAMSALGMEYYAWQSPNSLAGGAADWFKIIRNNDLRVTRYLIKLDKSIVPTLDLKEGYTLGLNIAVNDADILGRDAFYQFTTGTADKKHPSDYADFTLVNKSMTNVADGLATTIFPAKLEASEIAFDEGLTDIDGHWAKEQIESMYKRGVVNGFEDKTFEPDSPITRAEYFQMFASLAGYGDVVYSDAYSDVSENDWYASAIQGLVNNNMMPGDMVIDENILPNQEITREEAAYLAMSLAYTVKTQKISWYKWGDSVSVDEYSDGENVSEWTKSMLEMALGNGVLYGSDDGNLYPKNTVTRAEATVMLQRILKFLTD